MLVRVLMAAAVAGSVPGGAEAHIGQAQLFTGELGPRGSLGRMDSGANNPGEVAYFTAPVQPRVFPEGSNWAYSQPAFAPERREVWYSEAYTGFYAVKLTNGAWPDTSGTG